MVLDEAMNDPNLEFEAANAQQLMLPQLALVPIGENYSLEPWSRDSVLSGEGLPFLLFDDEEGEEEEDMDEDESFNDMDDDFEDDFDDDDDFEDEDEDYEDEDEDYDYEEDVDYDDFDE